MDRAEACQTLNRVREALALNAEAEIDRLQQISDRAELTLTRVRETLDSRPDHPNCLSGCLVCDLRAIVGGEGS